MKERHFFYFAFSIAVSFFCLIVEYPRISIEEIVVTELIIACFLGLKLLSYFTSRFLRFSNLILIILYSLIFSIYGNSMLPFISVSLVYIILNYLNIKYSILLSFTVIGLLILIFNNFDIGLILLSLILTFICLVVDYLVLRLMDCHKIIKYKSEEIKRLKDILYNKNKLIQSINYSARLNERNRLAVRIHDKVGHGISGSILLLEGALLSFDKNPIDAKEAIKIASKNLQDSVDDIRLVLREERVSRSKSGLAELKEELSKFESKYMNLKTKLITKGDINEVPIFIWTCIQESIQEALTNMLKHSNANIFSVSIMVKNKIVKVIFLDNGDNYNNTFNLGIGLQGIEDRCSLCNGRVFFQSEEKGFSITMIFTNYKDLGEIEND